MKIRRFVTVAATGAVLSLGFASAAHAVDYPPTTSTVGIKGSTATTVAPVSAKAAAASDGLPFTGGNDSELVWIGIAAVGTGTFAAWQFRRRTRVS